MSLRVPSRGSDQFNLRLPDGMRDAIKEAADVSGRSMNGEMIHRLQQSLELHSITGLYLDLPEALEREISLDALGRNMEMDERAIQVLSDAYRAAPRAFAQQLDKLEDEIVRNADLTDLVSDLKKSLERDFVLYYGKVTHISQFIAHLLASAGNALPADIRKSAQDLQVLGEAELKILRQRYEDGRFWIQRRENEARNAEEIASTHTDKPAWDEIARNAQHLADLLRQTQAADPEGADIEIIAGRAADLVRQMKEYNGDRDETPSKALMRK